MPSENVLPLCAAGLIACRELRQYEAAGMMEVARVLSAYLPTLKIWHADRSLAAACGAPGQSELSDGQHSR